MKMWDVDTIHRFLDLASANPYGDIYHLAVLTGMRRSELLGLQWKDLDMENAVIHIQRSLQRINGRGLVVRQTKTQKSRRAIALGSSTVDLFKTVKKKQLERRLSAGPVWNDQDFVFTQADGKPLHPDKVSNEFHKIVEANDLPHMTLQGFRHAHATLMLSAGVHPKVVSERLGHSNVSITLDIYSHLLPGLQDAAAQAVDDALSAGLSG
jgi:integrase